MGSVIDYIDCPNCGQEAYNDYYYKTGEEMTQCSSCGFVHSMFYKRGEDGKFVKKNEDLGYEFENLIMEEHIIEKPYASYRIHFINTPARQVGTFESEEQAKHFVESLKDDKEHTVESVELSRFINGEIITEELWKKDM